MGTLQLCVDCVTLFHAVISKDRIYGRDPIKMGHKMDKKFGRDRGDNYVLVGTL